MIFFVNFTEKNLKIAEITVLLLVLNFALAENLIKYKYAITTSKQRKQRQVVTTTCQAEVLAIIDGATETEYNLLNEIELCKW